MKYTEISFKLNSWTTSKIFSNCNLNVCYVMLYLNYKIVYFYTRKMVQKSFIFDFISKNQSNDMKSIINKLLSIGIC